MEEELCKSIESSKESMGSSQESIEGPKKTKGRPKKALVTSKKNPIGRPRGDNSVINEYKQRMLASPKSRKVLEAIFDAALDNEHKNQAAAWKLIVDRIAPISAFEQEVSKGNGKSAITINISGIGQGVSIDGQESEEILEGDWTTNEHS